MRAALLLLLVGLMPSLAAAEDIRRPPRDAGFAISLSVPVAAPVVGIGVYETDLFDTGPEAIAALHRAGGYVICYFSAGSYEDWRPDAAAFPARILGKDYSGWPGERWLNIRQRKVLAPILTARLELARRKGCDAVDPDNVDGFSNETGFSISARQQVAFNRWVAQAAHARGLGVGLKNAAELVGDLARDFDFAVIEGCAAEGSCGSFRTFAEQGKPVFEIEYDIAVADWPGVCAAAEANRFTAVLAKQNLDGTAQNCRK